MSMVTYEFSDFRRLFMVAYGYIWIHMDVYGHLCALIFAKLLLWSHTNTYGPIWMNMIT